MTVEVYNRKVVKIYFENGGWLDGSHYNIDDAIIENPETAAWAFFIDDRDRYISVYLEDKKEECYE